MSKRENEIELYPLVWLGTVSENERKAFAELDGFELLKEKAFEDNDVLFFDTEVNRNKAFEIINHNTNRMPKCILIPFHAYFTIETPTIN